MENKKFFDFSTSSSKNIISTADLNPVNILQNNIEKQLDKEDGLYEIENIDVIELKNITQQFKTDNGIFKLFDNFNLNIHDFKNKGQFISIMGESGCGKSQLLKIISGLVKPGEGTVKIYGKNQDKNNHIPMVFQQYSSFPWMTVLENVALPLKLKNIAKQEREDKAMKILEIVGLKNHANKWAQYPILSGGQLQRVSLARNLIASPQILLLDEATGALDIKSKRDMQDLLLNVFYNTNLDPTIINVTHSIEEAVYLSNRIYILKANPCSIYKIIDINYGENDIRTPEIRKSSEFSEKVREIEKIIDEINQK